jgi:hypothetical protein
MQVGTNEALRMRPTCGSLQVQVELTGVDVSIPVRGYGQRLERIVRLVRLVVWFVRLIVWFVRLVGVSHVLPTVSITSISDCRLQHRIKQS